MDSYVAIYVDAQTIEQVQDQLESIPCSEVEIEVRTNDYFVAGTLSFPDDFVKFRLRIELEFAESTAAADRVRCVATILERLWHGAIPAVAACDFETELPESGGYRSENVPWPQPRSGV